MPTIAVIGASPDRSKFGNKCVRAYASRGYTVYPIHPQAKEVEGHPAYPSVLDVPAAELDLVSIYLPPQVGLRILDDLAKKSIRQVWLNPGAESPEILKRAKELGLSVLTGCSIMAIGVDPAELGS